MAKGSFNNQVWNEQQWEAHIDDLEAKSRRLKRFITPHGEESNPRWLFLLQDYESELEVVDTYVMEELIFEEAYFPDEDDEDWEDDDEDEDFWMESQDDFGQEDYPDEVEPDYFFFDEDEEDGEEWKKLSEDYFFSEQRSIENLDLYMDARVIGAMVLAKARRMNPRMYSIEFIRYVDAVLKIATKIVAGYALGFEKDLLGGNIVYNKKALRWANYALDLLHNMKKGAIYEKEEYFELHEALFEVRNNLGIYVQDLRERFNNS